MDAMDILADCRVVPVVVIEDQESAVELAVTLLDAGIQAIEVTLRTPSALAAIEQIAKHVPDILVGAGSVRQASHFSQIADAGAQFAVSPGASEVLISRAKHAQMPYIPGAASASEILFLLEQGYELQKFFPAELGGGTAMLKALSAPLPEVKFFPTGGVTAQLAASYLQLPCVHCIGGTWIATPNLIASGDFRQIGELAKAALDIAGG